MNLKVLCLTKTVNKMPYTKFSKSEKHSPESNVQSRSKTPFHKHSCSPHNIILSQPKIQGPSFEFCTSRRFSNHEFQDTRKKLSKIPEIQIRKKIE